MGYQPKQEKPMLNIPIQPDVPKMPAIILKQCKCCGAQLSGSKCEYCGMVYEKKSHRKTINKKFLD